jgi:AP-3 complex subunit mu
LRYNSNEIYFDVVEELRAVVNKNGIPLCSNVWGKIETNAKLSGTPDLLLTFTNPHVLTDCAFHPCVRLQRWTRDKSLSFVPPDGHFILLDYRYAPSGSAVIGTSTPGLRGELVPVPIVLKTSIEINEFGGALDLTLTSRLSSRVIENLSAELYLGEEATGASCMTSGGQWSGGHGGGGTPSLTGGVSWGFDSKKKVLRWEIQNMPSSSNFHLRGSFTSSAKIARPAHAFRIRFEIHQHSFSALKVDQLRLTGEGYKPYKGVRGRSVGDVEWRW